MTPRRASDKWLWIAAALSFGISLTRWGPLALYPFALFTTWIHECSHAIMTLLVGGRVSAIAIAPDASGVTTSLIPVGRMPRALVASAGYLGASVMGCLLMVAARGKGRAQAILWAVGAFMLVTIVVWVRNPFGIVVVLAWASTLVLLSRARSREVARFVLSLLAIQVALNAIYDIRVLFLAHGHSDAQTMAQLFLLPAWLWASAWMLASVALLAWTLMRTR